MPHTLTEDEAAILELAFDLGEHYTFGNWTYITLSEILEKAEAIAKACQPVFNENDGQRPNYD